MTELLTKKPPDEEGVEHLFAARILTSIRELFSPKLNDNLVEVILKHEETNPIEVFEVNIFMTPETTIEKDTVTLTVIVDLREARSQNSTAPSLARYVNARVIELIHPHLRIH